MKRKVILTSWLSALLLFSSYCYAQENGQRRPPREHKPFDREAFFNKRNAFIAEKMSLSSETAAVFFPIENELLHKKFEVGRECFRLERQVHDKKDKQDEDFQKLLRCRQEVKEKRDSLDREYLEKFKKTLTAEQICKYQSADREFFDNMLKDGKQD